MSHSVVQAVLRLYNICSVHTTVCNTPAENTYFIHVLELVCGRSNINNKTNGFASIAASTQCTQACAYEHFKMHTFSSGICALPMYPGTVASTQLTYNVDRFICIRIVTNKTCFWSQPQCTSVLNAANLLA